MMYMAFYFPVLQKKEWLCLNCQTQRLMSGSLADAPTPQPSPKPPPMASSQHQPPANQQQALSQKGPNQQPVPQPSGQLQQQRPVSGQVSGSPSLVKQPVQAVPAVSREAKGPKQAPPKAMPKQPSTTPRQPGITPKPPETTPKIPEKDLETKPTPPMKGNADQITPAKDIKREGGSQKTRRSDVSAFSLSFSSSSHSSSSLSHRDHHQFCENRYRCHHF